MLSGTKLSLLVRNQSCSIISRSIGWVRTFDSNHQPVGLIYSNSQSNSSGVGIDLGTTKTCVAFCDDTEHKVFENKEGSRTTPSVVTVSEDDYLSISNNAGRFDYIITNGAINAVKNLLFHKYGDSVFSEFTNGSSLNLIYGKNDIPIVQLDTLIYQPFEIAAPILKNMKITAEKNLKNKVNYAVVTVPSCSRDYEQLKEAGRVAGFERIGLIKEPIAAALAMESHESGASDKVTAVYDFGGGKFEASIIKNKNGIMEAYSTGDIQLNGQNFDKLLINLFKRKFREQTGIDIRSQNKGYSKSLLELKKAADYAKTQLSNVTKVDINILDLAKNEDGDFENFNMELTRKEFENLFGDLLKRSFLLCEESIKKATESAKITKKDIDEIVLVGGITKIPKVKNMVEEIFGKAPVQKFDPEEILAIGAAVAAKKTLVF